MRGGVGRRGNTRVPGCWGRPKGGGKRCVRPVEPLIFIVLHNPPFLLHALWAHTRRGGGSDRESSSEGEGERPGKKKEIKVSWPSMSHTSWLDPLYFIVKTLKDRQTRGTVHRVRASGTAFWARMECVDGSVGVA